MNAPEIVRPPLTGAEYLPISQLHPSPTNPRRTFPEEKMAEMAASIQRHGVLQPILVRPWPETPGYREISTTARFEIIAGERRYRASVLADQPNIPALVRDLTDNEVLEIQIIENLQREEVHPLEEAEGYQVLMLRTGCTADELAGKVGKSKAYIYARLKLCAITGRAREAFVAGELSASVALLVARIPVPGIQEKAAKEVLEGLYGRGPMSAREAAEHLQQRYMLRLAEAPFPRGDASLVEDAPTCHKCPKRTGNARELFPDVKSGDVCTDPDCFAAKRSAHKDRQIAQAATRGQTVLTGHAAKKIAPYRLEHYSTLQDGYVTLDHRCYLPGAPKDKDGRNQTWRQMLGDAFQASVLIEDAQRNVLVEVAKEDDLVVQIQARGIALEPITRASAADKEREAKAKRETAYRKALLDALLTQHGGQILQDADLTDVATTLWDRLWHEHQKQICKLITGCDKREDLDAFKVAMATASAEEIARIMMMMTYIGETSVSAWAINTDKPVRLEAAAVRWGVSPATIRKQLAAQGKAVKGPACKYRHPHRQNMTWSGKGKKPRWVEEWLEAGNTLDELEAAA